MDDTQRQRINDMLEQMNSCYDSLMASLLERYCDQYSSRLEVHEMCDDVSTATQLHIDHINEHVDRITENNVVRRKRKIGS